MKIQIKYLIIVAFLLSSFSVFGQVSADALDQNQHFFVEKKYAFNGTTGIDASLRYISSKAYFYVENNYWNSLGSSDQIDLMSKINQVGIEFDNRIYPIETATFGSESNPGVDSDARITILLTPLAPSIAGFFDSSNGYSKSAITDSNAREMIYVSPALKSQKEVRDMYALLAHEFQHLISFNQKNFLQNVEDEIWTNELRSEYAVTLLGYNDTYEGSNLQRRITNFLRNPSFDLVSWSNTEVDYDEINLFAEYVTEHWPPKIITDTIKVSVGGKTSIDASLARNGYLDSYDDLYRYWKIATTINDCSINPRFCYTKPELANIRVGNPSSVADLIAWANGRPQTAPRVIPSSSTTPLPIVSPSLVFAPTTVLNGSLVRAVGDPKVYLIQNSWRRHILDPKVFPIYGWSFANVKEISVAELANYKISNFIRSTATDRVYEIDSLNSRHWLHMTEAQFHASARVGDSIFNVNPLELNFYKLGAEITR